MRQSEPNHEKIYVRFHSAIDDGITEFSKNSGMKRAATVRYLFQKYMDSISEDGSISDIDEDALGFSGAEMAYVPQMGRSFQTVRGKSMIVTLDKSLKRKLELLSMKFGYNENEFRTMIIASELEKCGILKK